MASLVGLPWVSNTMTVGTMKTLFSAAKAPSVVRVPPKPVIAAVESTVTSRKMTRLR